MAIKAVAKVASEVVDGLKGQPLALSLIIVNMMYLAAGMWLLLQVAQMGEKRDRMIVQLAARECRGSFQLQSDESKPVQLSPDAEKKWMEPR